MALPLISAGLRLAGRKILKIAEKATRTKGAWKPKKTKWKNKWDPSSKTRLGSMTARERRAYSRYDFKGQPIKGHPLNKQEWKHFGPKVQKWSPLKYSQLSPRLKRWGKT